MAILSQDDHDIITRLSLGDSLDHLQVPLIKQEKSYASLQSRDGRTSDHLERRKVVLRLLAALMDSEAALDLHSKTNNRDVASELFGLSKRVRKGDFNYSYYRPLVKLVIEKTPDLEIWSVRF
jgi:hypothetical protein